MMCKEAESKGRVFQDGEERGTKPLLERVFHVYYCNPKYGNRITHHCWDCWTRPGGTLLRVERSWPDIRATMSLKPGSRAERKWVLWGSCIALLFYHVVPRTKRINQNT